MNYRLCFPYPFDVKKVKHRLIDLGWTQLKLARRIKETPATTGRHITGRTRNPKVMHKIARALGMPIEELILRPDPTDDHQNAA